MSDGKLEAGRRRERLGLILSGTAALVLTTPAWLQGLCGAMVAAVAVGLLLWRLPSLPRWREIPESVRVLGLVTTSFLACNFYNTWVNTVYVQWAAAALGGSPQVLSVIGAGVMALLSAPAMAYLAECFRVRGARALKRMDRETETGISARKGFVLLFAIYVVGISAILRANFYYQDDMGRAAFGYKHWDYFGRLLSTALATFVHMGDYLTDITPLPQLLAMGVMALSGILLLCVLRGRNRFTLWELLAVVPLGLNPYFLECVSFRFDAVYMAVSVLAGIVPLLYRKEGTGVYILASMTGVLAVCTSYQAATGIFPMLVVVLALDLWRKGEKPGRILRFCLESVAGYGLGLIYFKLVLMRPADAGYVSNAMPGFKDLLPNTLNNLAEYYRYICTDFKASWLVMVGLLAVGFLAAMVRGAKRGPWQTVPAAMVALILMALLCFGIYPVLEKTAFFPRAMYGFGVLITVLCVMVAQEGARLPVKLPGLVLAWSFFVFAFTYGNALNLQKDYTQFRLQLVLQDVSELEVLDQDREVTVQISGTIGKTPILDNMPQNYQMLNRLVPETFAGTDDLQQIGFFYYYKLPNMKKAEEVDLTTMDLPVLKETSYHRISGNQEYVLIELK